MEGEERHHECTQDNKEKVEKTLNANMIHWLFDFWVFLTCSGNMDNLINLVKVFMWRNQSNVWFGTGFSAKHSSSYNLPIDLHLRPVADPTQTSWASELFKNWFNKEPIRVTEYDRAVIFYWAVTRARVDFDTEILITWRKLLWSGHMEEMNGWII